MISSRNTAVRECTKCQMCLTALWGTFLVSGVFFLRSQWPSSFAVAQSVPPPDLSAIEVQAVSQPEFPNPTDASRVRGTQTSMTATAQKTVHTGYDQKNSKLGSSERGSLLPAITDKVLRAQQRTRPSFVGYPTMYPVGYVTVTPQPIPIRTKVYVKRKPGNSVRPIVFPPPTSMEVGNLENEYYRDSDVIGSMNHTVPTTTLRIKKEWEPRSGEREARTYMIRSVKADKQFPSRRPDTATLLNTLQSQSRDFFATWLANYDAEQGRHDAETASKKILNQNTAARLHPIKLTSLPTLPEGRRYQHSPTIANSHAVSSALARVPIPKTIESSKRVASTPTLRFIDRANNLVVAVDEALPEQCAACRNKPWYCSLVCKMMAARRARQAEAQKKKQNFISQRLMSANQPSDDLEKFRMVSSQNKNMNYIERAVVEASRRNKVVLFTKSHCSYCKKALDLLRSIGVAEMTIVEIDKSEEMKEIQQAFIRLTGAGTVPRIYIAGVCIGGYMDMKRGLRSGEILKLLQHVGAIERGYLGLQPAQ